MSAPARRERLPKWAQDEIARLEDHVQALRRKLMALELQSPTKLSQGYAVPATHPDAAAGTPARWLPDNEHITFWLDDRYRNRDTFIQVRFHPHRYACLHIMGSDGPLEVRPEASNVVSIGVGKR